MFDDLEKNLKNDKKENLNLSNSSENNQEEKSTEDKENPKMVVEDMFAGEVDDLDIGGGESQGAFYNEGKDRPNAFRPVDGKNTSETEVVEKASSGVIKKIIFFVLFLAGLSISIFGAYYVYNSYFKDSPTDNVDIVSEENIENEESNQPENEIQDTSIEQNETEGNINPNTPIDKGNDLDGDGLSDQEEIELGTNISNIDTDGDGLFDREEVYVYSTNPNNSDTDGDGFLDGAEVDAGYNPNGEGKLYDINSEINGQ